MLCAVSVRVNANVDYKMKSSERRAICPICKQEVSADFLKHHIANKARYERVNGSQAPKIHDNYLVAFRVEKSII